MAKIGKKIFDGVPGLVIAVLVTIMSAGVAAGLDGNTLVSRHVPICIGLFIGLCAAIVTGKFSEGTCRRIVLRSLAVLVAVGSLATGTFYALNFSLSDSTRQTEVHAVVERKYTEEHYRTRRVSRRTVGRGEKYTVWYIDLVVDGGVSKTWQVSSGQYRRLHIGDTLTLALERGLFGYPVVKNRRPPVAKPKGYGY